MTRAGKIRILLVDDHPIVREGYRRLLERHDGLSVVGEAADGAEAYIRYKELEPDIVIMDISMPGQSGIEAVRHIRQWAPDARILIFSMHQNNAFAVQATQAGAKGYVTKSSPPQVLVDAVFEIMRGRTVLSADISAELASNQMNENKSAVSDLNPREFEILCLLAAAKTPADIAQTLNLSLKTVSNYHSQIKSKLGARSDVDLVRLALQLKLVELGP